MSSFDVSLTGFLPRARPSEGLESCSNIKLKHADLSPDPNHLLHDQVISAVFRGGWGYLGGQLY